VIRSSQFTFDPTKKLRRQLTAQKLEAMRRDVVRNAVLAGGPGVRILSGPNGMVLSSVGRRSSAPVVDLNLEAFEILDVSVTSPSAEARVAIVPGLIRNVMPTLGGTPLDATVAPYQVLADGTFDVWLEAAVTGSTITGVTVQVSTSALPTETETLAVLYIGRVTALSGAITYRKNYRKGSQWYQKCEGGTIEDPWFNHLFGLA
jgi:hypothetical protein